MSSLQVLKKRLKNIRSTLSMTEAMKTAATVKYAKVSSRRAAFLGYYTTCMDAMSIVSEHAFPRTCDEPSRRNCYVLMSPNRGFCGSFNAELFRFFDREIQNEQQTPHVILCGKKARSKYETAFEDSEYIEIDDMTPYSDAQKITKRIIELYTEGQCDKVYIISQHFRNMMVQEPVNVQILPYKAKNAKAVAGYTLLPDIQSIGKEPANLCLAGYVYGLLLSHASGAQAATMIAMKNACDNAKQTADMLDVKINRMRQAEVTNSVIETASTAVSDMER